jgi:hypothetical protein
MDNRQSQETSSQFGEPAGAREPAQPLRQVSAAEPTAAKEVRAAEPAVATDGQLVEAGYGHGV